MSEGLTRRRGVTSPAPAGSSNGNGAFDSTSASLPAASNSTPNSAAPSNRSAPNASGAVEGKSKVAYDPRDFEDGGEANAMPKLTLMEEVLLLGLKDKAVSMTSSQIESAAFEGCY